MTSTVLALRFYVSRGSLEFITFLLVVLVYHVEVLFAMTQKATQLKMVK